MPVIDRLSERQTEPYTESEARSGVMGELVEHFRNRLLKEANLERLTNLPLQILRAKIESLIGAMIREEGRVISYADRARLITFITNETAGYGPLEILLRDPTITEVMVNRPSEVYIERGGRLQLRPDVNFVDEDHIRHIIDRIVSPIGRRIDESSPMVDARLPDGSRVNAIIPPLALNGPTLTIRRFREDPYGVEDLIGFGTLMEDMAEFLRACVIARLNILISGGTGSGKTTTLNVLASFIPHHERVITIEDAAELQFYKNHPHVVRQEARPPNVEGEGEVTIRQLVINCLRMRPNRIVVGEVRGPEALDMLQAMNTGHDGSLTTVHANSPDDAFSRLETMVMWAGTELPSAAIRDQLVGALNLIIQQDRMPDGTRKITSVAEILGVKRGEIVTQEIFRFDQIGIDDATGRVLGTHVPTGLKPKCLARLKAEGVEISPSMFVPAHKIVDDLRQDPDITEIMINGPDKVYVERKGKIEERPDIRFRDVYHLRSYINTIVIPLGRRIDEDTPMVDARLPDGSRVNAAIPPVSVDSPVLTIRLFRQAPFGVEELLKFGTFSEDMVLFLEGCVRAKLNILISGGTGSGKTTTLNLLSGFIPKDERIVTVEDVAELRLRQPHVVRMEARPPDEEGEGQVTIRDLVINALRQRPDRIVVGEVRGAETLDMLQAMNTGHDGSLTTVHANSPADALSRLETMVMWAGTDLPSSAIRDQIVGAMNIILQQDRMSDGSRKITSITEVQGIKRGEIVTRDIFSFVQYGVDEETGEVLGDFAPTGIRPQALARLSARGIDLPEEIFIPAHKLVDDLRQDPEISEIMINGPDKVYVERKGKIEERPDIRFRDEYHLLSYINTIVTPLGRRIDEDTPMVDARLPDGSRVNAAIPPVSVDSPTLTIRLFRPVPFGVDDLLKLGAFSEDMIAFLEGCVRAKLNILISGGTGSGKTTTLNVLSSFIPEDERIITAEDVAELQLRQPHVVRMEARPPDEEGEGQVTIRDLVINALRQRPDRIVVGEVRGGEALDMLQAMNTGHDGSLTTIHANSSADALSRLETMVMWAETDLDSSAIRDQIVGAINVIVQQDRMADGSRKITNISEVQGVKKGEIVTRGIFSFVQVGVDEETGKVLGDFAPTGIRPKALARLKARGIDLPEGMFVPAHKLVEDLRQDPDITEIMVNGPDKVYIERKGKIEERPDIRFRDEYHLLSYINTIVTPLGRRLDEDNPMVDARLPDGSRVNAAIPPASVDGPVLTVRLFRPVPFGVDDLLKLGAFSEDMIAFLEGCVRSKLNILVSGGTGSGKTTTLNVLSSFIPESERVVTVEDVAELRLRQPHVVRMEARPPDEESEGEVTIRDLVINALRMRPDRIVVGEVRGGEALDMLQAMNTGHEGSLTTIHANSPADAFSRLETMVMWAGVDLPSEAIREQMASALHIVVQQSRLVDGSRRILTISEIQGLENGHIELKDVFVFDQKGIGKDGKVIGKFKSTGFTPRCLSQLKNFGVELPAKMFAGK